MRSMIPVTVLFFARILPESAESESLPTGSSILRTTSCGPVSPCASASDFVIRRDSVYR